MRKSVVEVAWVSGSAGILPAVRRALLRTGDEGAAAVQSKTVGDSTKDV